MVPKNIYVGWHCRITQQKTSKPALMICPSERRGIAKTTKKVSNGRQTTEINAGKRNTAFVDDVIKTGCDICATGQENYTIGDADWVKEKIDAVTAELVRVMGKYGDRDHLILEIVAHLRSLERYVDAPYIDHWTKNPKPN